MGKRGTKAGRKHGGKAPKVTNGFADLQHPSSEVSLMLALPSSSYEVARVVESPAALPTSPGFAFEDTVAIGVPTHDPHCFRILCNPTLKNRYSGAFELTQQQVDSNAMRCQTSLRMKGTVNRCITYTNKKDQLCQNGSIEDESGGNYDFHENGETRWNVGDRVSFVPHLDRSKSQFPFATKVGVAV